MTATLGGGNWAVQKVRERAFSEPPREHRPPHDPPFTPHDLPSSRAEAQRQPPSAAPGQVRQRISAFSGYEDHHLEPLQVSPSVRQQYHTPSME